MQLELLQAHDLLLYGGPRDHPVDVHHFLLSYSVGSVHCLQVLHWVPVMLNKDHLGGHSNHHTTTSEVKGSHQGENSLLGLCHKGPRKYVFIWHRVSSSEVETQSTNTG